MLACEFLRSTGGKHEGSAEVVTQIHQHMLERLLERMAPARRELLLQTALAPRFDAALAAALAGDEAARELDALVRQGILRFTLRRVVTSTRHMDWCARVRGHRFGRAKATRGYAPLP